MNPFAAMKKYIEERHMKVKTFPNEVHIIMDETDVLNFVTKSSTKAQRRKFNIGDIFINAAVCRKCGEYIRSKNCHDFKSCSCNSVAVDGGSRYIRRIGKEEDYINIIEYFIK